MASASAQGSVTASAVILPVQVTELGFILPALVKEISVKAGEQVQAGQTLAVLDTPYVYQGGDLVMHFTHTGSDSASNPFLDAANSSSPGYGTSFRALSANAFRATSGAAASVTIVQIVFTPTITQAITRAGNQVIVNGAGGTVGATYRILTSTNVALPAVQWTPIITNQFGASGGFGYTNVIQPHMPAQYFRVSMP